MIARALIAFVLFAIGGAAVALPTHADVKSELEAAARTAGLDVQGRSVFRPGPVIPGLGATGTLEIPLDANGRPVGVKTGQGVLQVLVRVGFVSSKGEVFASVTVNDLRTGLVVAVGTDGLSAADYQALLVKHGLGAGRTEIQILNSPAFQAEFAAAYRDTFAGAAAQAFKAAGAAFGRFDTAKFAGDAEVAATPAPPRTTRRSPRDDQRRTSEPVPGTTPAEDDAPPPPVRPTGIAPLGTQLAGLDDATVLSIAREFGRVQDRLEREPAPARRQVEPTSQEKDTFADIFFGGALTFGVEPTRAREAADESAASNAFQDELLRAANRRGDPGSGDPGSIPPNPTAEPIDPDREPLDGALLLPAGFGSSAASPTGAPVDRPGAGVAPGLVVGAFSVDTSTLLLPAPPVASAPAPVVVDVAPPAPAPPPPAPAPTGVTFSGTFPFLTSSFDLGGGNFVFDVFLPNPVNLDVTENGTVRAFRLDNLSAFSNVSNFLVVNPNGQNSATLFNIPVSVTGDALQAVAGGQVEVTNPSLTGFTQGGTPVTQSGDPATAARLNQVLLTPR